MKMLGIKSVIRRKKNKYKKSTAQITAENLLARNFYASKPNEKWATDVTEFKIVGSKTKTIFKCNYLIYMTEVL